jgi:hypothetical protein
MPPTNESVFEYHRFFVHPYVQQTTIHQGMQYREKNRYFTMERLALAVTS